MSGQDRKLWPYKSSTAFAVSIMVLIASLFALAFAKANYSWPGKSIENTVLLGIFILSLLPIILRLVDVVAERGAVVQYKDLKIDFSQVQKTAISGMTIPANIGVTGQPLVDSGSSAILGIIGGMKSDMAIIDLEEGEAWWETRLLVLLSGAVRHHQPKILVFVGKDGGVEKCFQGWGYARELPPILLKSHPKYQKIYYAVLAVARQWELVQPQGPNIQPSEPVWMGPPPGQAPNLVGSHPWMAFDFNTGLPNKYFAEQLLASELGSQIEQVESPKTISIVRLEELFRPVLHKAMIDETWASERQLSEFFKNDLEYMAVTRNGQFSSLIPRSAVLNMMVGKLVQNK